MIGAGKALFDVAGFLPNPDLAREVGLAAMLELDGGAQCAAHDMLTEDQEDNGMNWFQKRLGKGVMIEMPAYYVIGIVREASASHVVLNPAGVVYDTGPWEQALTQGRFNTWEKTPTGEDGLHIMIHNHFTAMPLEKFPEGDGTTNG